MGFRRLNAAFCSTSKGEGLLGCRARTGFGIHRENPQFFAQLWKGTDRERRTGPGAAAVEVFTNR